MPELYRPVTRTPRRQIARLDDRLAEWEDRHPVIATLLAGLLVGAMFLAVIWMIYEF